MKTRYVATSLDDIADTLAAQADRAELAARRSKHEQMIDAAFVRGLRVAVDLLRDTTIEPGDEP
jgi:hypothetical protein